MKSEKEEFNNEMVYPLITSEQNDIENNPNDTSGGTSEKLLKTFTGYDKSMKIILLGDSGVGKTSLLNNLEQKEPEINQTKTLEYFNYKIKINDYIIRMQIWDTVGNEKFKSITLNYYKTADVVIFIYAINDLNSFNNINKWLDELNEKGNNEEDKNIIKILVGNKKDLKDERRVGYEGGEKLKNEKKFHFFKEISCLNTNSNSLNNLNNSNNDINKDESIDINIKNIVDENKIKNKDIKDLFFNIGKIIYKENIENQIGRGNSSLFTYEASKSILEIAAGEQNTNSEDYKHKSCCC